MVCEVVMLKVCRGSYINYSYIVYDAARTGVLVDPAWDFEKISAVVDELQLDIKAILVTHEHSDHIDLAESMSLFYDAPIHISPDAAKNSRLKKELLLLINDESRIVIGELEIIPLVTPGHTKGSISYLIGGNLFPGDTLFIEGCGMCRGSNSSPHDLFVTMRRFVDILPLSTAIYPGHRYHAAPGQRLSYVLENNIYLNILNEEQFVSFRMREGQKGLMHFC